MRQNRCRCCSCSAATALTYIQPWRVVVVGQAKGWILARGRGVDQMVRSCARLGVERADAGQFCNALQNVGVDWQANTWRPSLLQCGCIRATESNGSARALLHFISTGCSDGGGDSSSQSPNQLPAAAAVVLFFPLVAQWNQIGSIRLLPPLQQPPPRGTPRATQFAIVASDDQVLASNSSGFCLAKQSQKSHLPSTPGCCARGHCSQMSVHAQSRVGQVFKNITDDGNTETTAAAAPVAVSGGRHRAHSHISRI